MKHHKLAPTVIHFEIGPRSIAWVVLTAGALWVLGQLVAILLTVVCALILVGTLNPLVGWLEKHAIGRNQAVAIVFLGCGVVATLIGLLTIPPLWEQLTSLAENLPGHQTRLADALQRHKLTASVADAVRTFGAGTLASGANVMSAVSVSLSVAEVLGYAATSLVLAIYFIADRERMRGGLYAVIPRSHHLRLARVLANLETIVGGYMRGQVITSVAIALFTFVLLTICGVPNALALAAFAGLTDVLPFVGGLLATTPAVLASLSQGTVTASVVLVMMLSYQEFESRVLVPRVYGRTLRLPPAAVVVALLVGGQLGGIIGALLALPLAAGLRMLAEELRFEMPGDDTDGSVLRARDARAERHYAAMSAGASAQEAGVVATDMADEIRVADSQQGKDAAEVPITAGKQG